MLSPVSKVVSVSEPKTDKNGRNYRVLRLEGFGKQMRNIGGVEVAVRVKTKQVSMTQYEQSYLNDQQEAFYDARPGEILAVQIHQATNLKPYEISDPQTGEVRDVTSYTFPVIEGETPLTVLKNAGHEFDTTTGEDIVNRKLAEVEDDEISIGA